MRAYRLLLVAVAAVALGQAGPVFVQYPDRPVKLVVPYPAGGGADIAGRLLAERLEPILGQPFVVENVAGAAGSLGAQRVASASADGYTLLLGGGSELLIRKLLQPTPYDTFRDFTPIGLVGTGPMVLIGKKSIGAGDLRSLIALARSRPGALSYGSGGRGTYMHLIGEAVKSKAGLDIAHVPYRGAPPVVSDIVSGHLDLGVVSLAAALPMIESGRVQAFAVTSAKRVDFAPSIPALSEVNELEGLHLELWMGLFGPSGLPTSAKSRLEVALESTLDDVRLNSKFVEQAITVRKSSGRSFENMIHDENERYRAIITSGKITAE
jgi:tripartite-type tricarboxylate transporter receptor subunit TctC